MAGLAHGSRLTYLVPEIPQPLSACTLVDLGPGCTVRESVAGYESALISSRVAYERTSFRSLRRARLEILPAAVFTNESGPARIRAHLESGSVALLETGAAFLTFKEFDFQRRLISSSFGLSLQDPIRLWENTDSFKQAPYVAYGWPVVTKIRDFSRIIPLDCKSGEVIGWFQHLPVAAILRVGKGRLILLGSPLGPHLLAGDREAGSWFRAFCSSC